MAIINKPVEALKYLENYIEGINKKLDTTYNKPKPLEKYPDSKSEIFKYDIAYLDNSGMYTNYFRWNASTATIESAKQRYDSLNAVLDAYEESLKVTRDINNEIIKHNMVVKEKVISIMKSIGIPDSYREVDTKSRSLNKKYIEKRAGYLDDIARSVSTVDNLYTIVTDSIAKKRVEIAKWYNNVISEISTKEKIEKENSLKQEKEKLSAVIKVKYNIDFNTDFNYLIESLIEKNKYLRLAHFLEKNRNDWNDGYHYAEFGLRNFIVEGTQDQEIYDNIQSHIDNWDGDGRIFRDCDWNYSRIYGLVDTDLLADYNSLKAYNEDI